MLGVVRPPRREPRSSPRSSRGLARAGVTPDMVTIAGTLGAVAGAVALFGTGHLFWGTVAVTFFVLLDLLDGALARARGGGSVFGAVLDSTGDRAADAAIFASLTWWFSGAGDNRLLVLLSLLCLVLGILTSYVKARAEGVGMPCNVGIVERLERLLLALFGTGLSGLGVPVRAARRPVGAGGRQRDHRGPADPRRAPGRGRARRCRCGRRRRDRLAARPGSPPGDRRRLRRGVARRPHASGARGPGRVRPGRALGGRPRRQGHPPAAGQPASGHRRTADRARAGRAHHRAPCAPTPATGRRPSGCRR